MDDILKQYELEMVQLRLLSSEFARRYPKVAGKLQIAGDACEDPHVERLIQSVALIAARISKRLDDDYPQFTQRLLDVLHPHYMRPFPSCAIVRFDKGVTGEDAAPSINRIARGSILDSAPVQGVPCRFRTTHEVVESALGIASAKFDALIKAPPGMRLPIAASCSIDIEIDNGADLPRMLSRTCGCSSTARRRFARRCSTRCSCAWCAPTLNSTMATGLLCLPFRCGGSACVTTRR